MKSQSHWFVTVKKTISVIVFTSLLTLTGCATQPNAPTQRQVDDAAAAAHQQRLAEFTNWQAQGQVAIFDLFKDERNGVYFTWQQTPEQLNLRFTHPLRGTLAELESDAMGASFKDNDDRIWRAPNLTLLVQRHLQIALPMELLQEIVTGALPENAERIRYFADATIASYDVPTNRGTWQVSIPRYQTVGDLALPKSFELLSTDYRIKLDFSQWQVGASS